MTTPSDNTPISIIQDAWQDAGLIAEGDSVNSEQIVVGMRKLTDLVNLMMTQGLKLWLLEDVPVPLVAGQNLYTLAVSGSVDMAKPLQVVDAYYQQESRIAATAMVAGTTYVITALGTTTFTSYGALANAVGVTFTATAAGTGTGTVSATNTRRPLNPMAWADYIRLSQTVNTGAINSYFVDKQATAFRVFFWLTPDATAATGSAHLVVRKQVTNFISVTETMNLPVEWRIALRWGLADEVCTGQPQAIMDRCQQRAAMYRQALEDFDVEDVPVRFAADSRGQYGGFR